MTDHAEALARVVNVYEGSSGDRTRALYAELEALGPAGIVAVNVFRATKTSERAKKYRGRRYRASSYETKQWSMDNLCAALTEHGEMLNITWGWGEDETQEFHKAVLYVDLPTGQVSFHTAAAGAGPRYPGRWDQMRGQGPGRICQWCARLLSEEVAREDSLSAA